MAAAGQESKVAPLVADASTYRGMFEHKVDFIGILVKERKQTGAVLKALDGLCFTHRGIRTVQNASEGEGRIIILDPAFVTGVGRSSQPGGRSTVVELIFTHNSAVHNGPSCDCSKPLCSSSPDPFPAATAGVKLSAIQNRASLPFLSTLEERLKSFSLSELEFATVSISFSFKNFSMVEMLGALLPPSVVVPSGFEQVGHIAHMNLQAAHEPYKNTIGQIVLDTNPSTDVVVNKIDSIAGEFREFKMEIIATRLSPSVESRLKNGTLLVAEVRQHGCLFRIPYDKVYWNSRLSHEHTRLVDTFLQKGDWLFDVMAGVGPFAIPAAQKGLNVFANDLNPSSCGAMTENCKLNDVDVAVSNMDGRVFVHHIRENVLPKFPAESFVDGRFTKQCHFVMNLPAIAVTFLDAFTGPKWVEYCATGRSYTEFRIHVYTFSAAADPIADSMVQAARVLGVSVMQLEAETICKHLVRDVSPTKQMVCLSFRLPSVLLGLAHHQSLYAGGVAASAPERKRSRGAS